MLAQSCNTQSCCSYQYVDTNVGFSPYNYSYTQSGTAGNASNCWLQGGSLAGGICMSYLTWRVECRDVTRVRRCWENRPAPTAACPTECGEYSPSYNIRVCDNVVGETPR